MTRTGRQPGRQPVFAYVDESYTDRSFYVLGAAVAEPRRAARLAARFEEIAPRDKTGRAKVHAVDLTADEISRFEDLLREAPEVRHLVTVRAPVEAGDREGARQRCVADLAVRLAHSHYGVRTMVIDSRDGPLDDPVAQLHARRHPQDALDRQTISALKGERELPKQFQVRHRSDDEEHRLWLADLACYAVAQAVRDDDPARLARLGDRLNLVEARRLPLDQRGGRGRRQRAQATDLSYHLARLSTLADRLAGITERLEAYEAADEAARRRASDKIGRAEHQMHEIEEHQQRIGEPRSLRDITDD